MLQKNLTTVEIGGGWVDGSKKGGPTFIKKYNFFKILKKKSFGGRVDGNKSNSKDCAAVALSYETDFGGAARNLNFCFFTIEFLLFYNRDLFATGFQTAVL